MASHCVLQYFFPSPTVQLQLGCAHFLLPATAGSFLFGRALLSAGGGMRLEGFAEQLNHGFVEHGDVIRLAAADPVLVANDFFVAPAAPGIPNIVLQRVIAGEMPASDQSSGNEQPWAVTDDGDRPVRLVYGADKFPRMFIHTELIRIDNAAGQEDRIEVFRRSVL
jgi:hypothetical protein